MSIIPDRLSPRLHQKTSPPVCTSAVLLPVSTKTTSGALCRHQTIKRLNHSSPIIKANGTIRAHGLWKSWAIVRIFPPLCIYDPRAVDFKNFRRVFRVTSVYIQTPYYFIPYDLDISFNGFVFDWAPQGTGPKAYNSYIMDMPSGAMITFLRTNHSSDPYLLTYENGESAYRRFVYSHYLDVPEALRSRIRTLLPVPHARTYEEKRAWYHTVSQFLQNNYRYTTHPGRTAAGGKDFISGVPV